jgi:hypothetical protein
VLTACSLLWISILLLSKHLITVSCTDKPENCRNVGGLFTSFHCNLYLVAPNKGFQCLTEQNNSANYCNRIILHPVREKLSLICLTFTGTLNQLNFTLSFMFTSFCTISYFSSSYHCFFGEHACLLACLHQLRLKVASTEPSHVSLRSIAAMTSSWTDSNRDHDSS